jgi:biopolymer transport protein ExbD
MKMAIDIKNYRKKVGKRKPNINLVPFIDILFTLLIFLVVTSSFGATSVDDATDSGGTGKPNMTDTTGDAEYYLLPVAGLQKVVVNGVDMSSEIRGNAIGVHARVLDQGDVQIKTSEHAIYIQAPSGMSPQEAVHSPE